MFSSLYYFKAFNKSYKSIVLLLYAHVSLIIIKGLNVYYKIIGGAIGIARSVNTHEAGVLGTILFEIGFSSVLFVCGHQVKSVALQ